MQVLRLFPREDSGQFLWSGEADQHRFVAAEENENASGRNGGRASLSRRTKITDRTRPTTSDYRDFNGVGNLTHQFQIVACHGAIAVDGIDQYLTGTGILHSLRENDWVQPGGSAAAMGTDFVPSAERTPAHIKSGNN